MDNEEKEYLVSYPVTKKGIETCLILAESPDDAITKVDRGLGTLVGNDLETVAWGPYSVESNE